MTAKVATNLWLSPPDKDFDGDTSERVGKPGMLIWIDEKCGYTEHYVRGTIMGGVLDGWHANDLSEYHYKACSPLELLALQAEETK